MQIGKEVTWYKLVIDYFKELLKPKSIYEIINKELREAHLRKLEAESGVEYAKSIVTYNEQRIARLQKRLVEHPIEGDCL
jgi:fibronectin type 3 domain-containing protein